MKAIAPLLKGGDTLLIGPGTYPEPIDNSWPSNLKVQGLGAVVFNKPGTAGDIVWLNNKTGIQASGIAIDGGAASQNGLRLNGSTSSCTFQSWTIYNVRNANGVFVQDANTTGNKFYGLRCSNIGSTALHHAMYIRASNTLIDSLDASGIFGYAVHIYSEAHGISGCQAIRCKAHDSKSARGGILAGGGAGYAVTGTVIRFNLIYNTARGLELYGTGSGTIVENNTVVIGSEDLAYIKSANHSLAAGQPRKNVFL